MFAVASLLLLEGSFAFCYDTTDSWGLLNTSQLWFRRHAPRTNNLGARERGTVSRATTPSTIRLFFLGDSFTWGHGIARQQDRFTDLVGSDLYKRSATLALSSPQPVRRFECHNVSYLGADTGDELKILNDLLSDGFEFDILILVYCMNDISGLIQECIETIDAVYEAQPSFFLWRDTYFFNFVYHRLSIMRSATYRDYYGEVRRGFEGAIWETHREQLREMVRVCRAADVELRVVTFPLLHDLGDRYGLRAAHMKLGELWAEESVPHIDLLDVFSGHKAEELVVNRFDAHPNELAHQIVARTILTSWFSDLSAWCQAEPP
jgi:hypothetical protein